MANKPKSVNELCTYTKQQLNNLKKDEIIEILLTGLPAQTGNEVVIQRIDRLSNEMNGKFDKLRTELKSEFDVKNTALQKEVDVLKQVMNNQQRFLEQVDSRLREKNLVMMSVTETNNIDDAETDEDKIKKVMEALEEDAGVFTFKRLGAVTEGGRDRPILVTVESNDIRERIVKSAPKLDGSASGAIKNVRIKRDSHPAIRKEWKRLFDAETSERNKPENRGCTIEFDKRKRQIKRDGVVIDSWCPLSFL